METKNSTQEAKNNNLKGEEIQLVKKLRKPLYIKYAIGMIISFGIIIDFIGAIMNDMAQVTVGSCLFGINLLIVMIKLCRSSDEAEDEERQQRIKEEQNIHFGNY